MQSTPNSNVDSIYSTNIWRVSGYGNTETKVTDLGKATLLS